MVPCDGKIWKSGASHRGNSRYGVDTLVLPVGDEGAELGGTIGDVDGGRVDAGRVGAGT